MKFLTYCSTDALFSQTAMAYFLIRPRTVCEGIPPTTLIEERSKEGKTSAQAEDYETRSHLTIYWDELNHM